MALKSGIQGRGHRQGVQHAIILVLLVLSAIGCGKRKPPIPPKERVAQRVEINGFQRGGQVILSWKMPARNAGKNSILYIDRADIYRLAEPDSSPLTLTEEEFSARANVIASLKITDADFGLKTLQYKDELKFARQAARLRYAIRFVNASGQKAAYSNFLLIEPTAELASAPEKLASELSQDAVTLRWAAPAANIDGSTPANIVGYNIYRSNSQKEPARLLNEIPVNNTEYSDENFEFGKQYYYFVRAVSVGKQAEPIESSESNVLAIRPLDTFAPSPPEAITLAAGRGVISIFFAVNPEKDIAGYRIYRSTDDKKDLKEWALLTKDLLKTNTFQDTTVMPGAVYFYYITATDTAGNTSEPSEIVSETAQ
ncbi:MAG: hypothetical protein HS105_08135 [Chloracidobacterium sp.]|nr:hypothetical protein [Chloracidobacterium sp.]MCO5333991.1 hypothetical protein [Pyrinomonadaceae bacterium]